MGRVGWLWRCERESGMKGDGERTALSERQRGAHAP